MWAGWIHNSWRFGHAKVLRAVGPEIPERGSKTSTVPVVWSNSEFFRRDPNDFLSGAIGDHGRNLVISLWPGDKRSESKIRWKILASIFWDQDGIPLIYYLPKGQTINMEYYSSLLVQLRDILKEKRREKFTKCVLLLHDNVSAHRTLATQNKLAYLDFKCLDHPPYSPDLAPSDYHLFLDWRNNWKVAIFLSTRRSLLPWRPSWRDKILIFLTAYKGENNGLRSVLNVVRSTLNKSRVWSL